MEVDSDIKPGSDPNSINMGSNGLIPVAILSTSDFDATDVDPETVSSAGADVGVRGKGDKLMASIEDVNGDTLPDLVVHIENALDLSEGQAEATLTGYTFGGISIQGPDSINIVKYVPL